MTQGANYLMQSINSHKATDGKRGNLHFVFHYLHFHKGKNGANNLPQGRNKSVKKTKQTRPLTKVMERPSPSS
jgi:hypothetical protein